MGGSEKTSTGNQTDGKSGQSLEHEEAAQLRVQLISVQEQIADTILEYDDIRLQANPQLQHRYMITIGSWKQHRQYADIAARKSKRRYELVMQRINTGQPIDLVLTDRLLEREMAHWQNELLELVREYNDAVMEASGRRLMNEDEGNELSNMYKILMKRLHPDLNSNLTDEERKLLYVAQTAYKAGDLLTLKSLVVATGSMEKKPDTHRDNDDALAVLEAELTVAQKVLREYERRLEELKEEFPYRLKDQLFDEPWLSSMITSLKQDIENLEATQKLFDNKLANIIEGDGQIGQA